MLSPDRVDVAFGLSSTARMFEEAGGKLRIRTGIWNHEEAVIDVGAESAAVARSVRGALRACGDGPVRLAEHLDAELSPTERLSVEKLFADLLRAGVLVPASERSSQDAVTAALLGWSSSPYPEAAELTGRPVVFLSDCAVAPAQAQRFADDLRLTLVALPVEHRRSLAEADLTSRVDGYHTELRVAELRSAFADAAAVVTCWQRPELPLLRNLNRILEGQDKPWVNALIDGPFVTVAGFQAPHTGCFECFELRSLARLEDHVLYHDFARVRTGRPTARDIDAPMMGWLTVLAVTEGYLYASVGSARLSGRVLGIHLPTLEIQAQDLLRMPNCPACGRVARQRAREINLNSRAVIDRVVSQVLQ